MRNEKQWMRDRKDLMTTCSVKKRVAEFVPMRGWHRKLTDREPLFCQPPIIPACFLCRYPNIPQDKNVSRAEPVVSPCSSPLERGNVEKTPP